jgi:hypothetical protein
VAVVTPTFILGAESASLCIFPVRLPTKDVAVTTPAVTSVPLTRLFADPTMLPVNDVAVMTPVAVIPLTVIIPIGAINWAFS